MSEGWDLVDRYPRFPILHWDNLKCLLYSSSEDPCGTESLLGAVVALSLMHILLACLPFLTHSPLVTCASRGHLPKTPWALKPLCQALPSGGPH